MSGIFGIYFLDGRPVDSAVMESMGEILAHRGSDCAGVWRRGSAGLGHRLLWTTAESLHEQLPLANRSGHLVISADARIDNRQELLSTLNFAGRPSAQVADSELILAAYKKWGEGCPDKLLGDFAFAIWDGPRRTLFCARDYIGIRPFYYYYRPGRVFVFASEIKALFCLPEVDRRLNETWIAHYLAGNPEDKTITPYQEIFRLPPATSIHVDREQTAINNFWSPDPQRELHFKSEAEYAEGFREIFTEAVRCRLRSAFPIGSLLSGGLDSSSVVCQARRLLATDGQGPLQTFSAVYDEVPESDERPFIKAVLAQGGLEPHLVHPDRLSPLMDLERVFWHEDGLFWGPNLFMYWGALYPAVQQQGVRVLLDGEDGDTTVSHGYGLLLEMLQQGRWRTLAHEINCLARLQHLSPWQVLWTRVIKPMTPEPIRRSVKLLIRRLTKAPEDIMNPNFARRLGWSAREAALVQRWPKGAKASRAEHWLGLTSGLDSDSMELINKAAAAYGIEPRHPFYDRRLVEYCLALPGEQKLQHGWNRVVLRRALAPLLPPEVAHRAGKGTLAPNFHHVLLAYERPLLERVILHDPGLIRPYVDLQALREAYRRYAVQGEVKYSVSVWLAAALSLWLKNYYANNPLSYKL